MTAHSKPDVDLTLEELKNEIADLKRQIRMLSSSLVESHGVKWKRKASGGFEEIPYCPKCRVQMNDSFSITRIMVLLGCPMCGHPAPFVAAKLEDIRMEVLVDDQNSE